MDDPTPQGIPWGWVLISLILLLVVGAMVVQAAGVVLPYQYQ